jgi:hypothetical protein
MLSYEFSQVKIGSNFLLYIYKPIKKFVSKTRLHLSKEVEIVQGNVLDTASALPQTDAIIAMSHLFL